VFTELKWKVISKGRKRQLVEDYTYKNSVYNITVKAGFITDGTSIHKVFWVVLSSPFEGPVVYGAVIHDGLYTSMVLPRKVCDGLLRKMIIEAGYNSIKANLVYIAVRLFGSSHWEKSTKDSSYLIDITVK